MVTHAIMTSIMPRKALSCDVIAKSCNAVFVNNLILLTLIGKSVMSRGLFPSADPEED